MATAKFLLEGIKQWRVLRFSRNRLKCRLYRGQEPPHELSSLIGKIIVIKFGGNAIGNESVIERLIDETIALQNAGAHVIVVHGGGSAVNDALAAIGKKTEKVNGCVSRMMKLLMLQLTRLLD